MRSVVLQLSDATHNRPLQRKERRRQVCRTVGVCRYGPTPSRLRAWREDYPKRATSCSAAGIERRVYILRASDGTSDFSWDFQPIRNVAFYVGPSVGFNFGFLGTSGLPFGLPNQSWVGIDLQVAVDFKLVLGNRGLLFARVMGFDMPILFPTNMDAQTLIGLDNVEVGGGVVF